MDTAKRRRELARFLSDRRGRLRPADVGLPDGGRRRVAGLRREVATLAGLGVSWYTMLENGTAINVSSDTLAAIARALRLDSNEIAYLNRLAEQRQGDPPQLEIGPLTRGALAAIEWAPAYVCTSQWMVIAWNRAMSLVWDLEGPGGEPFNIVSRMFRDPALRAMHGERFPEFAGALVAMVRASSAARLEDSEFREMCDDLRTEPLFAAAWDTYDVLRPMESTSTLVESVAIGPFAYRTLTLEVPDDAGHWIVLQIPDAPSATRLRAALSKTLLQGPSTSAGFANLS